MAALLRPLWNGVSVCSPVSILLAMKALPEASSILSEDNCTPDYEARYYVQHIVRCCLSSPPASRDDLVASMERALIQANYLYLRRKPAGVYVLNVHQSKGREFDHVIIPLLSGTGEGIHLGKERQFKPYDYWSDDDRRLLYVALSRARKRVTIMYPPDDPSEFLSRWKLMRAK